MGYAIPLILLLLLLGVIKEYTSLRKLKREHEEKMREFDELEYSYGTGTFEDPSQPKE